MHTMMYSFSFFYWEWENRKPHFIKEVFICYVNYNSDL